MEVLEAIYKRHSVRHYQTKPIEDEVIKQLENFVEKCNQDSGLKFQLVLNDENAFKGLLAHYGKLSEVRNYIALVGGISSDLDTKVGYYGEKCVIKAQQLGLNSCWLALTFNKRNVINKCTVKKGEKLVAIIAIGYGVNKGKAHKGKFLEDISSMKDDSPEWFKNGVKIASLAPTGLNKQHFYLELVGDHKVKLNNLGGKYSKIDLGIVKYHFEVGAGIENFEWA